MAGGFFIGGLTQGLAQGMAQAEERKRRKEQLDLEKRKLQLEEDIQKQKLGQLKDIMTGRQSAANAFEQGITGGTPAQMQTEEPGDPALGFQVQGQPGAAVPGRPLKPTEAIQKQAIMEGQFGPLLKTETGQHMINVGVGGTVFDPTSGKEVYRNPTERTGVGVESQLFNIEKKIQAGTATPEETSVYNAWIGGGGQQGTLGRIAGARGYGAGAGGAQGRIDVQTAPGNVERQAGKEAAIAGARTEATQANQPLPAGEADRMSVLKALMGTAGDIEKNFNESYLGPIQGTDIAFEARRRFGGPIGKPLGKGETIFRQALKDAKDQILRARSGAQINESEASRLAGILPKATDEPGVFQAGMLRFKTELNRMMSARTEFATTPRKNIGQSSTQAAPTRLRFNPATGQIE